jgi:carbamoyl-phosphate synthase small subunit
MLSNGPGDPATVGHGVQATRDLLGRVPLFGICLGHQLLGQAVGGRTVRLKFGHRGVNQPVVELATGRVAVTSHNHGFAVDGDSLPSVPAFSVQYHPEAAPGPHDAHPLFERFADLTQGARHG